MPTEINTLDLRGRSLPETGTALLAAYDAATPDTKLRARVDQLSPALEMWLIEAGARHDVATSGDAEDIVLTVTRARSPALTAAPGVHHIVGEHNGSLWAAKRGARVARIDADSGEVIARADVADKASHLALDPSGRWLYLADFAAAELIVLRAADLRVEGRFPAAGGPQLPVAVAEGIACLTGPGRGTMTVVQRGANGFSHAVIDIGDTPHDGIAVGDGRHVFVACAGSADIAKVDAIAGIVVGRVSAGAGAAHIAAHPDGNRFYCANSFDGTLTAFSADGDNIATTHSGNWAHHPEVSVDGAHVYVANFRDDVVAVFNATDLSRVADLPTEPYAHEIAVNPDGKTIVLPGYSSESILVYDAATFELQRRITVGAGSPHVAFADGGRLGYVTCSVDDHIAQVELSSGQVLKTISI